MNPVRSPLDPSTPPANGTAIPMDDITATANEYRVDPIGSAPVEYAVFLDGEWQFGLSSEDLQDIKDAVAGRESGPSTSYADFRRELGL